MRRFIYIFFALSLAVSLALSVLPESVRVYAAEAFSLKAKEKTLYLGPGSGLKSGTKVRLYKHVSVNKLVKGFDPDKYDIRLKTGNKKIAAVSSKKDRIYARGIGSTSVEISIRRISDGETVYSSSIKITVKNSAEIKETASDTLYFSSPLIDEEPEAEDFVVYEEINGIPVFHSYVSKAEPIDKGIRLELFKCLGSSQKYFVEYDGIFFGFLSEPCSKADVESFKINENSINAGEDRELTFKYYNHAGVDITRSVGDELDRFVKLEISEYGEYYGAYINGHKLHIVDSGKNIKVKASLDIGTAASLDKEKILTSEEKITSLPKKGSSFTGNTVYSVEPDDGKYLNWGDKCRHSVPMGDEVVLEALFEMDDGKVKDFKEAGITELLVGDMKIAMLGKHTDTGGVKLLLNSEGTTSVIAFRDDEIAGSFEIEVLPKRKPAELKVELSKDRLNTNILTDDYIIVRTDLYDQYGDAYTGSTYKVSQKEENAAQVGAVVFNEMSSGRFLVNGWECTADTAQKAVTATAEAEGFTVDFKFYIRDVSYDPSDGKYEYRLEADGSKLIDTATGLRDEAPKSTFVTTKISLDGYYVGEGLGYIFDEVPSARNGAAYYGLTPGDCVYGITVEHETENGEKRLIGEDEDCIVPTYYDLEFIPYMFGEKLDKGTYDITLYLIDAGKEHIGISICDTMSLRVIDSDPDIEVIQLAQTYTEEKLPWDKAVTKYFSFRLGGEDISKYITKVDCVEAPSGSVYVRSVDFLIPDPYFGKFTKTAFVERLITKQ